MKDKRVLNNDDKVRAYGIVKEIQDYLNSISNELLTDYPFKYYLMDKLKPIMTDINCLEGIFNESEE